MSSLPSQQSSPQNTKPLEQLHDIALPEAVNTWAPVAPGWIILFILLIITLFFAIKALIKIKKKKFEQRQWQKHIEAELEQLKKVEDTPDFHILSLKLVRQLMSEYYHDSAHNNMPLYKTQLLEFSDEAICDYLCQGKYKTEAKIPDPKKIYSLLDNLSLANIHRHRSEVSQ